MRIGVNALFLLPGEVGGTETYLREMVRCLARDDRDQLIVFCNRENAATFADHGGRVERIPCPVRARFRPGRILYEQVGLPRRVAGAHIDVLWSPGYTSPYRSPCASVVTIHDLQFRRHPEDFSRVELLVLRWLVALSCARADHVLTVSTASAQDLMELGGVPAERLTAIPHGVSPEFFAPIDPARAAGLLREVGVTRPFLLSVANSYPHKNLARLVQAFGRLEGGIDHALVIVGRASRGEAPLREACRRLQRPDRVVRLAGLSRETLRALYQAADLFVLPTRFEGFGLPVLEAMASGTPVACSDIPVLRQVAGDTARFFEPDSDADIANTIAELLGRAPREGDLRRRAVTRAHQFTWETSAARTREAFEKAIASRSPRTN